MNRHKDSCEILQKKPKTCSGLLHPNKMSLKFICRSVCKVTLLCTAQLAWLRLCFFLEMNRFPPWLCRLPLHHLETFYQSHENPSGFSRNSSKFSPEVVSLRSVWIFLLLISGDNLQICRPPPDVVHLLEQHSLLLFYFSREGTLEFISNSTSVEVQWPIMDA